MEVTHKSIRRERGAAIVELTITVAVLLFFALAGMEFARSFKYLESVAILSREAASIAFRDCAAETDLQLATVCYQKVRTRMEEAGKDLLGPTSVIMTAFTYSGDQEACDSDPTTFVRVSEGTYNSRLSVINNEDTHGSQISRKLVCDNRIVIVSEVFVEYKAIFPVIPRFFSYNPSEFYDVAVM